MTIEISEPEIEKLILERMRTGGFQTPEEAVAEALRLSETPFEDLPPAKSLVEAFERVRKLQIDLNIEREPFADRTVDL